MSVSDTELETPRRQHDPETSWRFACPEGHVSITFRQSGGYYCNTCRDRYDGEPIDKADRGEGA